MEKVHSFLLQFHSFWAYLVTILSILLFLVILFHFVTKKPLHRNIRKISFYTVLSFHIQFLVGLAMYAISPKVKAYWEAGTAMSDSAQRLITLEHPLMMFTAVILMTIANAKIKRTQQVNVSILIFLVLALLCFYMIPWSQWMSNHA